MNSLEFAIAQEQDGEKYYREQAQKNEGNCLEAVCCMLADDERNHALILGYNLCGKAFELSTSPLTEGTENLFKNIGDLKLEDKKALSQLDFYGIALAKEQESINLYRELLSKAEQDSDNDLFVYLIGQEKLHYDVLESLVMSLRDAEQRVESARIRAEKREPVIESCPIKAG